ncbi:hypothetical protein [Streptomyces sp. NPDC089915]|uniref:hypothetical protein n=1 Tax=Streptomyces sp. NPDC089915 TaxID=3155186 RepID=UPI00343BAFA0
MTTTPSATPPATPSAAKAWAAAAALLLSLALAACGTHVAGRAAPPPPPPPSPSCAPAAPNLPTDEDPGTSQPPTDEDTGAPRPPTDEDPGTSQPPTDEDTGAPQPPTDEGPGTSQPPTDQDAGTPQPPTDQDTASGAPAGPCPVVDGWYDMTREFNAYYDRHRTDADRLMPSRGAREVRVRKDGGAGQARLVFTTGSVGKGLGEDARRLAQVFAQWRHEVYGDTGTVRVRTPEGTEVAALSW